MPIINSLISWFITKRMYQIDLFRRYPAEVQEETLVKLLERGRKTLFGKDHGFSSVDHYEQFARQVPVREYHEIKPYIDKALAGEKDTLWPGEVKWFAKSSGTTSDKSKFIPVTRDSMEDFHFRGAKDAIVVYLSNYPDSGVFLGKSLAVGGSQQISNFNSEAYFGDLSAVLLQNLPFWAQMFRTPDLSIALMDEWEAKIDKMARTTSLENVTNISGVPSWTLLLLKKVLEITGKSEIHEVWPNLEVFVHGGVSFEPYRKQYQELIQGKHMRYMETYNASEGFFGVQDDPRNSDMLLMLDYGIFYEFMPIDQVGLPDPKVLTLDGVETGVNYAIIITTSGGLWRYLIGDTVRFSSLHPVRFRITGRTRHFINAFGEELIIDDAESALKLACLQTDAEITEYTAGPVYMDDKSGARHQWCIEFKKPPSDLAFFTQLLDNALKAVNSDYEAKRHRDLALHLPEVIPVGTGTFYQWMKNKGKLGGQHKVPRLSNNREIIQEILNLPRS